MKPKTSDIWQYFVEIGNEFARCKVCDRNYSRKGRTTTSLKSHLKSMHKEKYAEFCKIEEQREIEKVNQLPSTIPPLQQAKHQMWDSAHAKAKTMDNLIGEMIALQNLPLNFVESIGFRRIMQTACPKYEIRDSIYFTALICGEIYWNMTIKVRQMLKQFPKLSLTTDVWSEPCANSSYLSLTAHGITEDFTRIRMVLECCSPYDRHIGDDVRDHFKMMLLGWLIMDNQIHCFVHNGSSNSAMNLASINCTVHQIQACVRSALENCEVKDLIEKCKMISGHFLHSKIAHDELIEIQTEKLHRSATHVIQDCGTKWNSTYLMLERLLEIQDSVYIYASNHNMPHITPEECLCLHKLVAILNPFEEIMRSLSDTKTCISSVIPLIHALKYTLLNAKDKFDTKLNLNNLIMKIIKDINVRFCDLENNSLYSLATYLDPRYKLKFFNEITKEQVLFELLRLLTKLDSKLSSEADEASTPKRSRTEAESMDDKPGTSFQTITPTQTVDSSLSELLKDSSDEEEGSGDDTTANNSKLTKWKSLISEYNKEKRLKLHENPLMWWRNNTRFYAFAPIARAYLSPPAGSVSSEDLYIGADLTKKPLRDGLDAEKAAKLLFVKYNFPLVMDSQ